jgi:hypothetical protein
VDARIPRAISRYTASEGITSVEIKLNFDKEVTNEKNESRPSQ